MNCFSEIFFSTLSQQKLMRKKFLVKQKYLLILKIKNKMKNLKNLNLVELNAQEVKSIDGGDFLAGFHAASKGEGLCPGWDAATVRGWYAHNIIKALSF